jgi:hypothetical protein
MPRSEINLPKLLLQSLRMKILGLASWRVAFGLTYEA